MTFKNLRRTKKGPVHLATGTVRRSPHLLTCSTALLLYSASLNRLTCLDVRSGKYWQANQRRETRSRWLPEVV